MCYKNEILDKMEKHDVGVKIREGYLIIGYFHDWLVAVNEKEQFFVMEEPVHVYVAGTYCDADAELFSVNDLSQADYEDFIRNFLKEE